MPNDNLQSEHWEALRLSWKSRHFPFGTLLLMLMLLAGISSAVLTVLADGPSTPIP